MKAKLAYQFLSLLTDFQRDCCSLYGDDDGGVAIFHNDPVTFDETILLDDSSEGKDIRQRLVNAFGKAIGDEIADKWDAYLGSQKPMEDGKKRYTVHFNTSLGGLGDQECTKTVLAKDYDEAHALAVEMKTSGFNPDVCVTLLSVEEDKDGEDKGGQS